MFDILAIQYKLNNGFRIKGNEFAPEAYLVSVDEPEFGCEGRPEGETVYARIKGITIAGIENWKLEAEKLDTSGLFDNMWIGTIQTENGKQFVGWQDGAEEVKELNREIWDSKSR